MDCLKGVDFHGDLTWRALSFVCEMFYCISKKSCHNSVELIPEYWVRIMPRGNFVIKVHHTFLSFRRLKDFSYRLNGFFRNVSIHNSQVKPLGFNISDKCSWTFNRDLTPWIFLVTGGFRPFLPKTSSLIHRFCLCWKCTSGTRKLFSGSRSSSPANQKQLCPFFSKTSAHLLDSSVTPSVPANRVETKPMFLPILILIRCYNWTIWCFAPNITIYCICQWKNSIYGVFFKKPDWKGRVFYHAIRTRARCHGIWRKVEGSHGIESIKKCRVHE